jgi:hypothetical protein
MMSDIGCTANAATTFGFSVAEDSGPLADVVMSAA